MPGSKEDRVREVQPRFREDVFCLSAHVDFKPDSRTVVKNDGDGAGHPDGND